MNQHVVAGGNGPDYDWSQDHISVKTPHAGAARWRRIHPRARRALRHLAGVVL